MSSLEDRDLLDMAAKASHIYGFVVDAGINTVSNATPIIWNPLTDDGDALRLAVKLTIHLKLCRHSIIAEWSNTEDDILESRGSDPYAATRRAIVRAAAEIGRSMP